MDLVNTARGAVAFEVIGEGPAVILFVHGLGADRRCFDEAARFFEPSQHTLLLVDLPGFGESPPTKASTLSSMAHALEGALLERGQRAVHIVAHSMGGAVALLLADLGGVEPLSFACAEGNLVAEDAFMSSKVARLKEQTFPKIWTKWLGFVEADLGNGRQHRLFLETLKATGPQVIYRTSVDCSALTRSGELERLFHQLRCPRLYLIGEQTFAKRELPAPVVEAEVPVVTVAGSDHFLMEEAQAFYPPLRAFIDQAEAARP